MPVSERETVFVFSSCAIIKSGLSVRDFSGAAIGVLSNSVGTIVFRLVLILLGPNH